MGGPIVNLLFGDGLQFYSTHKSRESLNLGDGFIFLGVTLWLFNIAIENGPFIDGLPIKNADFPYGYENI